MRARSEPEPDPNRTLWTGFTEVQVQVRQNMPGPGPDRTSDGLPLTTQNGGKCQHCWMSLLSLFLPSAIVKNTMWAFFLFTSQGNRLFIAILSTSTFISDTHFHSLFICSHSKLQLLDSTWIRDYLVHGGASFRALQCSRGVLDDFEHGKLGRNRSWLVSIIDSRTVVFVPTHSFARR